MFLDLCKIIRVEVAKKYHILEALRLLQDEYLSVFYPNYADSYVATRTLQSERWHLQNSLVSSAESRKECQVSTVCTCM